MRQVLGGLLFIAGMIVLWWGFLQSDDVGEAIPTVAVAIGLAFAGVVVSRVRSTETSGEPAEDLAAKENNRKVAVQVAAGGGMVGILARQWLAAYESDNTVPIYGVRPYWTPTGPGGTPELLSLMGMRGVRERLQYVRETELRDPLLEIMGRDPHRDVREAVRARG